MCFILNGIIYKCFMFFDFFEKNPVEKNVNVQTEGQGHPIRPSGIKSVHPPRSEPLLIASEMNMPVDLLV